jgi:hypothetical protein
MKGTPQSSSGRFAADSRQRARARRASGVAEAGHPEDGELLVATCACTKEGMSGCKVQASGVSGLCAGDVMAAGARRMSWLPRKSSGAI